MRLSTLMRWGGPVAIMSGVFMVFSDLAGLPIEIPYLSHNAPTGYDAVGSGVILFALVLLVVGMIGLYASRPKPGRPRVIEYGDARARYVLVELEEPSPAETTNIRDHTKSGRPDRDRGVAARHHRTARPTRRI